MRAYEFLAEDIKKDLLILKKWSKFNTPEIGKLVANERYRRADEPYLYRGLSVDSETLAQLRSGESITLPSKGFSSWTEDPAVAERFAYAAGGDGIVIKKPARSLQIWLNVDQFLFYNKIDPAKVLERTDEREIIVKDNLQSITVSIEDIIQ